MPSGFPDWQRPGAVEAVVGHITVAVPGAGNQWSQVVPAGEVWAVMAVAAVLNAAAGGGDRVVTLYITRGGNTLSFHPIHIALPAATILEAVWFRGAGPPTSVVVGTTRRALSSLPEFWLSPGDAVSSQVIGMAAGDAWSSIRVARARPGA